MCGIACLLLRNWAVMAVPQRQIGVVKGQEIFDTNERIGNSVLGFCAHRLHNSEICGDKTQEGGDVLWSGAGEVRSKLLAGFDGWVEKVGI